MARSPSGPSRSATPPPCRSTTTTIYSRSSKGCFIFPGCTVNTKAIQEASEKHRADVASLHRKYKGYNVFELATYKNAHKIKIFKFKMAKLADGLKKAGSALALATSKAHCGQLHHYRLCSPTHPCICKKPNWSTQGWSTCTKKCGGGNPTMAPTPAPTNHPSAAKECSTATLLSVPRTNQVRPQQLKEKVP